MVVGRFDSCQPTGERVARPGKGSTTLLALSPPPCRGAPFFLPWTFRAPGTYDWNPVYEGIDGKMIWDVLALGAGVQSTAVLMMSIHGDLPPLDFAVFSDTGSEPASVYRHLEWLEAQADKAGIEIIRTGRDESLEDSLRSDGHQSAIPAFVDKGTGSRGMLLRYCTVDFKVAPKTRAIRERIGVGAKGRVGKHHVRQWFGISYDEVERMHTADVAYMSHIYPLVDRKMTRDDCHTWMADHGYPESPRSACYFCPYHSDEEWRRLRDEEPAEWDRAIRLDADLRTGQLHGVTGEVYLHDSLLPLADAPLTRIKQPTRDCGADCAT